MENKERKKQFLQEYKQNKDNELFDFKALTSIKLSKNQVRQVNNLIRKETSTFYVIGVGILVFLLLFYYFGLVDSKEAIFVVVLFLTISLVTIIYALYLSFSVKCTDEDRGYKAVVSNKYYTYVNRNKLYYVSLQFRNGTQVHQNRLDNKYINKINIGDSVLLVQIKKKRYIILVE